MAYGVKGRSGALLLVEALFGLTLFSGVLLVLFGLFPASHRTLTEARRRTEAAQLAFDYLSMERDRSVQPEGVTSTMVTIPLTLEGVCLRDDYQVTATRQTIDRGTPDERQSIMVKVSWQYSGTTKQVQVETLVAQH